MHTPVMSKIHTQMYYWLEHLPVDQFELVYRFVEEFFNKQQNDTSYLLSSETMKARLLAARASEEGIPFEVVRNELGI